MKPGDFVYILEGDEDGSWGTVAHIDPDGIHVAIAGGHAPRLYNRDELRRPRKQTETKTTFGIA